MDLLTPEEAYTWRISRFVYRMQELQWELQTLDREGWRRESWDSKIDKAMTIVEEIKAMLPNARQARAVLLGQKSNNERNEQAVREGYDGSSDVAGGKD